MSDDGATPQDDEQETSDESSSDESSSDESSSEDTPEPPPAGEEPEPAPAGEEPEPPPSGEGPEPPPEGEDEPEPEPSENSSDDDSSSSGKKRHRGSSSDNDDSDSSSSSDDSSSSGGMSVSITEDDVQSALTAAFQDRNVPVDSDGVAVTTSGDMFHLSVRLTEDAMPLPQVPDDTSELAPGSVQGAWLMVLGTVQRLDGGTRVSMRVVKVETSEILQTGQGDAIGTANKDAVQAAAEDALAGLTMLRTQ